MTRSSRFIRPMLRAPFRRETEEFKRNSWHDEKEIIVRKNIREQCEKRLEEITNLWKKSIPYIYISNAIVFPYIMLVRYLFQKFKFLMHIRYISIGITIPSIIKLLR